MIKIPGRLLALAACLWFGGGSLAAQAQTAVPVPGGGSYASDVPPANLNDGYDGPPVGVVLSDYDTLFLDPSLKTKPIPTNQWWTDLITGQKSRQDPATGKTVWFQQPFDPRLWLYPGTVQFQPTGMTLFTPSLGCLAASLPRTSLPDSSTSGRTSLWTGSSRPILEPAMSCSATSPALPIPPDGLRPATSPGLHRSPAATGPAKDRPSPASSGMPASTLIAERMEHRVP